MAKRGKGGNGMRLICPNCRAQYEVDDNVIPESGRDVQCSACGHTWFQPSRAMIETAEEEERAAAEEPAEWEIDASLAETATETATAEELESETEEAPPEEDALHEPPLDMAELTLEPGIVPREEADFPAELEGDFEADFEAHPVRAAEEAEAEATVEPEATVEAEAEATVEQAEPEPVGAGLSKAIAAMMSDATAPATPPDSAAEEPPEFDPVAPAPAAGAVPRRAIDDSLLAILREEAEREAAARRSEGSALETQEEMNLEPDTSASAANRAAAKLATGTPTSAARNPKLDFSDLNALDKEAELAVDLVGGEDEPGGAQGPSRREMLPDIEEINSTLRASADRGGDAAAIGTPQARAQQRSGFRFGFTLVLAIALIAVLLYVLAPRIGTAVPMLAPVLDGYVTAVNAGRIWLDGQLRAVIDQVQRPAQPLS